MLHTLHLSPYPSIYDRDAPACGMAEDVALQVVALSHAQAQLWLPYLPR